MKKNNFMQGAFIATLGIVITKILGIIYVIPFYGIIGDKGGALYGYAYNIYNIFLNISSAGIPMAMSKIISEYHALGLYEDKMKAFKIGKRMAIILSIISFIILFVFAPKIAYLIIGDIKGGNSIDEIALVIRIISTAIIVVPILSVYRGFFQGHKYIEPTSKSQVLEQIVRVTIIVLGSFLSLKVFNLSLTTSVGIAVFGATAGAFCSYFYIIQKYLNNISHFDSKEKKKSIHTNKEIILQIILYAIPLVLIDVFKTLYNSVDMITLVKTMVNDIGYSIKDAEAIMSIISTWGSKLNMIVTSIGTGIVISLVPNLSTNFVKEEKKEVNNKVNQSFQILLFFVLPMTFGLSLLSRCVWTIFYGVNELGFVTFSFSIFIALFMSLFSISISIVQILKEYKCVYISLVIGFLCKCILNIPLIHLVYKLNLPAQFGSVLATIMAYIIPTIICLIYLKKKFKFNYYASYKNVLSIMIGTILMSSVILLLELVLPTYSTNRFVNIPICLLYTIVGGSIYLFYLWKKGIIQDIFGEKIVNKIINKFKKRLP